MTMQLSLTQRRYVETVLAGLPHLAEAVAAIPPDWQPEAFQAAERSYLRAFRQLELSGPQTWTSSVMRRLRRRVREVEKEKLTKLYEQLSVNEHGPTPPIGQAHSLDGDLAASSEEQKSVEGELSPDEQIDHAQFTTDKAASSEEQKDIGGEFYADEHVGQGHNFATDEAASEQNVVEELRPHEQIGQAHSFAGSSRGRKHVGRELYAYEQVGQAHNLVMDEAASSEKHNVVSEASPEEKSVARESVKKDRAASKVAKIIIKVEDIFDDCPRQR